MMSEPTQEIPGIDFLRYVLESICDDKSELSIEGRIDELGVLLTVRTSERDMGKLIGKGGQTVKALRTLLRILGSGSKQRINLKIMEPNEAA